MSCWDGRRGPRGCQLVATLFLGVASLGFFPGSPGWMPKVAAANGDVMHVSTVLSGIDIVDVAQDISDGSFWVLGADGGSPEDHLIYNLDRELTELVGTLDNPHPSGVLPNLTTNRGIAYHPLLDTLFVLSSVGPRLSQSIVVREAVKPGDPPPGRPLFDFTITPSDGDASLFGLTYDLFRREFWTLDTQNDKILRFATTGEITKALTLPGKDSVHTILRGQGLSFDLDGAEPRLQVTHGDIFTSGPARIREFNVDTMAVEGIVIDGTRFGVLTGVEIPLEQIPASDRRGIQTFTEPPNRQRVAVVGAGGTIYVLERSHSQPRPPTDLHCVLTLNNEVLLSWKNHGGGPDGAYGGSIQIVRNGVPLATILGNADSFLDEAPPEGRMTYHLRASESGASFGDPSSDCRVVVGAGGLVNWAPFPGEAIFDVAEDSATREIYVTDSLLGRVFKFDASLQLVEDYPSPFTEPDRPGGIAFIPSIVLGFPNPQLLTDLLAVAENVGNRVRLVSADSPQGPVISTISLNFQDVDSPQIGGLAYVESENQFVALELTTRKAYTFTKSGGQVRSCASHFLIGVPLDGGIAYDPIELSFLATFQDGLVREIFPDGNCTPSGFNFSLESIGEGFDATGAVGGVQISENTLLVCKKDSNALFRVLTFPFSPDFIRGDFNADVSVNITDARNMAMYLFLDGSPPPCSDAADANDDGFLDVSDPVFLLFALFVPDSPPPPDPFPDPGKDPTFRDNLGCAE